MSLGRPMRSAVPILFTGLFLLMAGGVGLLALAPEWRWDQVPFHAAIEAGGAFLALALVGIVLALRKHEDNREHHLWTSAGLLAMGILDLAQTAAAPGETFVWLHSAAVFAGGALFSLVWLPARIAGFLRVRRVLGLTAAAALAVCALSFCLPGAVPVMVEQGVLTTTAWGLNTLGGLGFLAAALWFLMRHGAGREQDNHLLFFACSCLLLAVAGVLYGLSVLWSAAWWWCQVLRLAAYCLAFCCSAGTYHRINERLHHEIGERNQSENELRRAMHAAQQSEKELCKAVGDLQCSEVALADRVAELTEARDAAIRMMQDAERARAASERAQKSLQAEEKRLRSILDSIRAGVVVIDAESHVIVEANPAALNMIGASKEEVIGQACHKRICPGQERQCPITDPKNEIDNLERLLLQANGQVVPVLRTVIPVMLNGRQHLLDSFVDISERKRAELELVRSNEIRSEQARALAVLLEFSQSLVAEQSRDTVLEKTVSAAAKLTFSHRVSIMLPDEENRFLTIAKAIGMNESIVAEVRVAIGDSIAGRVFQSRESIVINTPEEAWPHRHGYDSKFFASVPLVSKALSLSERVVGVLNITERQDARPFEPGELRYMDLMCNIAASAIDDIDTRQARDEARDSIVIALAKLAEYRDTDTGRHLDRVTEFSVILASDLEATRQFGDQIDEQFLHDLRRAMPLHDVGKVAIPDHILLKPGKLTPEEMAEMRMHAEIGAKTLRSVIERAPGVSFLTMAEEIARGHHERYDGTGYPRAIKGADIPLSARIAAVVDVYDALTTKRVYKDAMPHETAVAIIREGSGSQFDSTVVEAFLRCEGRFAQLAAKLADDSSVSEPLAALVAQ